MPSELQSSSCVCDYQTRLWLWLGSKDWVSDPRSDVAPWCNNPRGSCAGLDDNGTSVARSPLRAVPIFFLELPLGIGSNDCAQFAYQGLSRGQTESRRKHKHYASLQSSQAVRPEVLLDQGVQASPQFLVNGSTKNAGRLAPLLDKCLNVTPVNREGDGSRKFAAASTDR